ncbi:MAG: N-acetylneuraminate synthase family protein [Candidatus Woesearchaeota archaeon]|nr:MAG: N-acetylneuraminate synthase family protein [Candidatus Woesearchaeota archaeon]
MNKIKIGNRLVGEDQPVFVIAEAGINHDGKYNQALKMIDAATEAGVDAVKFQLFKAKKMYHKEAGDYTTAKGEKKSIYNLMEEVEVSESWIPKLMSYCKKKDVIFICTACDEKSADTLANNDIDAIKMASFAITHIPLLKHCARKQKPIIFSTGCALLREVEEAYHTIRNEGNNKTVMMHCIGKYPAPLEVTNARVIQTLKSAFPEAIIGFSDHSEDPVKAPTAAVAMGARVIEKHFTLDKTLPGADHSFALNPKQLKQMVEAIREAERKLADNERMGIDEILLGSGEKKVYPVEEYVRKFAYRGIFTIKDIKKGDMLTKENIDVLRPGEKDNGLHPRYYEFLLNKKVKVTKDIKANTGLTWDYLFTK